MKRVLVVDDDPQVSDLIGEILARGGYRADTASNGREALDHIYRNRPDALLIDLGLPGAQGWRLLDACRRKPELTPIALVATSADVDEAHLATRLGARGQLVKPFGISAVLQLVDQVTASS